MHSDSVINPGSYNYAGQDTHSKRTGQCKSGLVQVTTQQRVTLNRKKFMAMHEFQHSEKKQKQKNSKEFLDFVGKACSLLMDNSVARP